MYIILMNEIRARELLSEVKRVYNSGMIGGLQQFVREYRGPEEDRRYLEKVFKYITKRNQQAPHTRLFGIDDICVEVILEETGIGSKKGREWLEALARNHISNTSPQSA